MSLQLVTSRPNMVYFRLKSLSATPGTDCDKGRMPAIKNTQFKLTESRYDEITEFRLKILAWYDTHRREMPWRAEHGESPNPYHVWLSEIMLQQTLVAAVKSYFIKFTQKWPQISDLANAPQEEVMKEWAGLGYYARARNLHKCAQIITSEYESIFPQSEKQLRDLPGIGEYTSASISAIAFNKPANVVDGNIERIMARYFNVQEKLPAAKKTLKKYAAALSENRTDRPGDYAQALMDIGATICTPKSPKCMICPIHDNCHARKVGSPENLPLRTKNKNKPQRHGQIFWIENKKQQILLEKRHVNRMLGGMMGFPTSDWDNKTAPDRMPAFLEEIHSADIKNIEVKHSFTHFDLLLSAKKAELIGEIKNVPENYIWVSIKELENIGFPTVFKKFYKLMV